MEESALVIARLLTVLDLPVAIAAALIGLITTVRGVVTRVANRDEGTRAERVAVGLCMALSLLGVIGVALSLLRRTPLPTFLAGVFAAAVIIAGLPALVWRTKWRTSAEGIATIAVGAAAFLSGFTIGFLFVPLVLLMCWVCVDSFLRQMRA
jgi:uncharacterized membrane protein YfcA